MIKSFESFKEDNSQIDWDVLMAIGKIYHDRILKSGDLKELYLAIPNEEIDLYEDDIKDWEITDNNLNINSLDVEFEYYFMSFMIDDFYLSNIDKSLDHFKKITTALKNTFKGVEVRVNEINSKDFGKIVSVKVLFKKKDLSQPDFKNLIKSYGGLNKFNL